MTTRDPCREAVVQAILDVAPEIPPDDLRSATDLQRDLGLDSIDLVNVAGAIAERTGVEIPDAEFTRLREFGSLVEFVAARRGRHD
jgi:acyl carrier protein